MHGHILIQLDTVALYQLTLTTLPRSLVQSRDAPIRQWLGWWIPINTKNLYSYLLEGLQSADKKKRTQKQNYKTHPLLPETKATLMFVYFW